MEVVIMLLISAILSDGFVYVDALLEGLVPMVLYAKRYMDTLPGINSISQSLSSLQFFLTRNTVIIIVFMLGAVSGAVRMLTKDKSNISVVVQMCFIIRYQFGQKKYKYVYGMERRKHD
ncbi:DUF6102 family protein [Vallitaleaceae bacterium 9-2]